MIIKISPKQLIYFQIVFNFTYNTLQIFNINSTPLYYITHVVTLGLAVFLLLFKKDNSKKGKEMKTEYIIVLLYLVITILGIFIFPIFYSDILFNQSIVGYIKGFLNFYRTFIFYFACVYYLDYKDVGKIYKWYTKLFVFNVFLCAIEFLILGCKWDYLGGSFGIQQGCNAGLNICLCITVSIMTIKYLNKKMSLRLYLLVDIVAIAICAIAELKLFYFEFAIIIVVALLLEKKNVNSVKLIVGSIGILTVGLIILGILFPDQLAFFLNPDSFADYASDSYEGRSLGRLSMFLQLEEDIFKLYPVARFFGFGVGAFDPTTSGYIAQKFLYLKAPWFGNATIVLNFGYVGLVAFYVFLIVPLIKAWNLRKSVKNVEIRMYLTHTIIMVIIMLITLWYNNTMTTNRTLYPLIFFLVLPTLIRIHLKKTEEQKKV